MSLTIDDILNDQAGRYGMGINEYLYGSSSSYTPGEFDANISYEKGNPFFTQTNQPQMGRTNSASINRPFVWQGNNKSLRQTFEKGHREYWNNHAKSSSNEQFDTWKGPQIRPEYADYSNGLSHLGTPSYWQDNNRNRLFEDEYDDLFPTFTGQEAPVGSTETGMGNAWELDPMLQGMGEDPNLEGFQ